MEDYRAGRTPEGIRRAAWRAILWTVAYAVAMAAVVGAARAALRRHGPARRGADAVWEEKARNVVRLRALWDRSARDLGSVSSRSACSRPTSGWMPCSWRCPGRATQGTGAALVSKSDHAPLSAASSRRSRSLFALAVVVALTVAALRIMRALLRAGRRRVDPPRQTSSRNGRCRPRAWCGLGSSCRRDHGLPLHSGIVVRGIQGDRRSSPACCSRSARLERGEPDRRILADLPPRLPGRRPGEIAGRHRRRRGNQAQATHIRTPKNERVTLPNALVLSSHVDNYTHLPRTTA